MKIACLLITHFRAKLELRQCPDLKDRPAVIVECSGGKSRVLDSTPPATGVLPGIPLEQALSIYPYALVLEADEPHYRRVFNRVLTSLQQISDRVEDAALGTAYVRLDGVEHLYGYEARLVNALLNAVPQHLAPRAGVSDAKFPAFVATLTSDPLRATRVPSDAASFLAPHTVDLLPVSTNLKIALHRFGLHTMGDVASLGQTTLVDRFGPEGQRALQLSKGIDDSPLIPLAHTETIVEHTSLPFSSASMDLLLTMVDTLLKRAYSRPSMQGRYAGRAFLECVTEEGTTWTAEFAFKGGAGSRERAFSIINARMKDDHPQGAVEDITLTLDTLTGESGVQIGLLPDVRESSRRQLIEVERDLRVRTGGKPALYRVVEAVPRHPAPEMRSLRVSIDSSVVEDLKPVSEPVPIVVV